VVRPFTFTGGHDGCSYALPVGSGEMATERVLKGERTQTSEIDFGKRNSVPEAEKVLLAQL
jgi:hypothetical protein